MNIFNKIKFFFTRPSVIIVFNLSQQPVKPLLSYFLNQHFSLNKEVFILQTKKINKVLFYLKNSPRPVLVLDNLKDKISTKNLPSYAWLILNYDDPQLKQEINNFSHFKMIKYGFSQASDVFISDIKTNHQTNFKVNYQGSIVPFWLNGQLNQEQLKLVLITISVGLVLGLNLVEISQSFIQPSLKDFFTLLK